MTEPEAPRDIERDTIDVDDLLEMDFGSDTTNQSLYVEQGLASEATMNIPTDTNLNSTLDEKESGIIHRVKMHWKKLAFAGGLGVATAAGLQMADHDLSSMKSVDITEAGRGFIDVAETAAPILLGAAALQIGAMTLTRPGRKNLEMSALGLHSNERNIYKTLIGGMLLPTIGIGALSTALMIEDGIHRGADKNISSITSSLKAEHPNKQVTWILQKGSNHFMNDSDISPGVYNDVKQQISDQGQSTMNVSPFYRDLVTLPTKYSDNQASMIISVSGASPILPEVKDGAICDIQGQRCNLKEDEIIVDEGEGFNIGDSVQIRGHQFRVVAYPREDQSLVNRLIAYTGVSDAMTDKSHYGLASLVDSKEDTVRLIEDMHLEDQLDVLSTEEFMDLNNDFWSHNGTPLLILLIGDIAIFAGVTFSAMKKFEQERDRPVLATLRAVGASSSQIAHQQYARTTIQTSKGILPGAAIAGLTAVAINNLLPGFSGEITPSMIAASSGLALAVQMGSTTRSVLSGRKNSLAQEMKSS